MNKISGLFQRLQCERPRSLEEILDVRRGEFTLAKGDFRGE
jgi:hypothetical protein